MPGVEAGQVSGFVGGDAVAFPAYGKHAAEARVFLSDEAQLITFGLMFSKLGLTGNPFGRAIRHTILQLPFSIYLMRNSFEGIPKEMEEAAVTDGASSLFALRRVFLPLVAPGRVTVALFAFIISWHVFLGALILMNTESSFTVPIMLTGVGRATLGRFLGGALQASVMLSILPRLAVYVLLQKYYVSGFLSGAVK